MNIYIESVVMMQSDTRCYLYTRNVNNNGRQGGGCVAFVSDTLAYGRINVPNDYECTETEM